MSTKRAVQLASKLQNEENARLRLQVFTWVEESKSWAKDMMAKYKETSKGGLAVNVVEC